MPFPRRLPPRALFGVLVLALLSAVLPSLAVAKTHRAKHHKAHHKASVYAPAARRTAKSVHAAAACANANAGVAQASLATIRAAVLCLVNAKRAHFGLPALHEDGRLDHSAQSWTSTLVSTDQFTHGSDFAARISAAGFNWSAAGENIATGYPTPTLVVQGWMASTGHCENILAPNYSAIGIGMVAAPVRGFATGPATWTQDFALPMGAAAPSHNTGPAAGCPYTS